MVAVRIPRPDIEADVTAEQVTAYLLARGWRGPVHRASRPVVHFWIWREGQQCVAELPSQGKATRKQLRSAVIDIARAEQRHPSAVLADITGTARGVEGQRCTDEPAWEVGPCAPIGPPVSLCPECGDPLDAPTTADECSAPHGAEEE